MGEPRDDDVFERFNRAQGMGSVRDPHPLFAALRARGPVVRIDLSTALAGNRRPGPLATLPPEIHSAVRYEAADEVLRDARRFSSRGYHAQLGEVMGPTILAMDPPEHGRHRALLRGAFSKTSVARWEREILRPEVERRVEALAGRGRADLVRELTFPFPVAVIARLIGLEPAHLPDFHRWAVELISVGFDPERGRRASARLRGLFAALLAERRRAPRDDLAGRLAAARPDGEPADEEILLAFLRLLAPAGAETTYRASSNLLFGLLADPAQWEAVRADPAGLAAAAVEEALRWEPPVTGILRTSTGDTRVAGVPVPAGATVHVNLASANRDEGRWEAPDRFDVHRPPRQHLAFAAGPHRCLGQHLARTEMRVVLECLLERLPDLRLDPEARDVHVTGLAFRTPLALPVRFTPPARGLGGAHAA